MHAGLTELALLLLAALAGGAVVAVLARVWLVGRPDWRGRRGDDV